MFGEVRPGELCCILGASGAGALALVSLAALVSQPLLNRRLGKTSLLDILAGFEKEGSLSGQILIDGAPFPAHYKKMIGHVHCLSLSIFLSVFLYLPLPPSSSPSPSSLSPLNFLSSPLHLCSDSSSLPLSAPH